MYGALRTWDKGAFLLLGRQGAQTPAGTLKLGCLSVRPLTPWACKAIMRAAEFYSRLALAAGDAILCGVGALWAKSPDSLASVSFVCFGALGSSSLAPGPSCHAGQGAGTAQPRGAQALPALALALTLTWDSAGQSPSQWSVEPGAVSSWAPRSFQGRIQPPRS